MDERERSLEGRKREKGSNSAVIVCIVYVYALSEAVPGGKGRGNRGG